LSRTEEAPDLRVLLELRKRLKSAAEKELTVGTERVRWLRGEVRRAEAELRLCAGILGSRQDFLSRAVTRVESAQSAAGRTCGRLSSLEQESGDLAKQLDELYQSIAHLGRSVGEGGRAAEHGAVQTFAIASSALKRSLLHAAQDQEAIQARTRDLEEETAHLNRRSAVLHNCLRLTFRSLAALSEEIVRSLDGETWGVDDSVELASVANPSASAEPSPPT
jgi:chromosome segregation ATPase